jgi:hypothetical protein
LESGTPSEYMKNSLVMSSPMVTDLQIKKLGL